MPAGSDPLGALPSTVVVPRTRDLGDGFTVRRALPAIERRMVGPFIFFDQMGPTVLGPGRGLDVRPHPHIGLATVTYLFHGEISHRDSLGTVQPIRPGEVNWMVAGSGIAHSERTPDALRPGDAPLFGLQTWLALPKAHEETAPSFAHHAGADLPVLEDHGVRVRVLVGELFGARARVATFCETLYADCALEADAVVALDRGHEERAAYVVSGSLEVAGRTFGAGELLVFPSRAQVLLRAGHAGARIMLLGGDAADGERHVYWNFVSSSRERIVQAADDWQAERFARVPGDDERIPLPEAGPHGVLYP